MKRLGVFYRTVCTKVHVRDQNPTETSRPTILEPRLLSQKNIHTQNNRNSFLLHPFFYMENKMQSLLCFFYFSIFLIFLYKLLAVSCFGAALVFNLVFGPSAASQPVRTSEPFGDAGDAQSAAASQNAAASFQRASASQTACGSRTAAASRIAAASCTAAASRTVPSTPLTPRCSMYCMLSVLQSLQGILTRCFDFVIFVFSLSSRTHIDYNSFSMDDDCSSSFSVFFRKTPQKRRVAFSTVSVREYAAIKGEHPHCIAGIPFPLSLDWPHTATKTMRLDDYERSSKRKGVKRMTDDERKARLKEVGESARLMYEHEEDFNDVCRKLRRLRPLLRQLKLTHKHTQTKQEGQVRSGEGQVQMGEGQVQSGEGQVKSGEVGDFASLLDESQQNMNQVCDMISRLQPLYQAQQTGQEKCSRQPLLFYKPLAIACVFIVGIAIGVGILASFLHTSSVDPTTHAMLVTQRMKTFDVIDLEPSRSIPRPVKLQDLLIGQDSLLLPAPSLGNVTFTSHLELVIIPSRLSIDLANEKELILRGDTSLSVCESLPSSLQALTSHSQVQIHPSENGHGDAANTALQIRGDTELDLPICYYRRDRGGASYMLTLLCVALILFVLLKKEEVGRDRAPHAWPDDDVDIEGLGCDETVINRHESIDWSDALVLLFETDSGRHVHNFPDYGPALQAIFQEQEQEHEQEHEHEHEHEHEQEQDQHSQQQKRQQRRPRRRRQRQQQQRKSKSTTAHKRRPSSPLRTTDMEDWTLSFEVLFEAPLLRRSTRLMGKPRVDYRGM